MQIYQCFVDERIGDGRRVTASRAFLPQGAETVFAPTDGNTGSGGDLALRSHCTAAEIVLDDLTEDSSAQGCRRARGVRYLTETGTPATATARQEVIVCAGVIGSPQLLLLSGIGPRSAFESHSDRSVKDGDDSGWKWPQCKVCRRLTLFHLFSAVLCSRNSHPFLPTLCVSLSMQVDLPAVVRSISALFRAEHTRGIYCF